MIEDNVTRFISEDLSGGALGETITADYPLLERGVLDSLGLFQLVGFIESEYGVEIQDEELVPDNFGTVGTIARLIETKRERA